MSLKTLTKDIQKVSQSYTKHFGITPTSDWYILKLQEELGELIQSYLMMIGQARRKDKTDEELADNFRKEIADVFCHVLLLAQHHNVDLEKEVDEKWRVWLKPGSGQK